MSTLSGLKQRHQRQRAHDPVAETLTIELLGNGELWSVRKQPLHAPRMHTNPPKSQPSPHKAVAQQEERPLKAVLQVVAVSEPERKKGELRIRETRQK